MKNYFETTVTYFNPEQKKKVSEIYLFDAVSYTDAEKRSALFIANNMYEDTKIKDIKKSNITEVIGDGNEKHYKCKVVIIETSKSGKEKRVPNYILVPANNLNKAAEIAINAFDGVTVPTELTTVTLTKIVDVIEYTEID